MNQLASKCIKYDRNADSWETQWVFMLPFNQQCEIKLNLQVWTGPKCLKEVGFCNFPRIKFLSETNWKPFYPPASITILFMNWTIRNWHAKRWYHPHLNFFKYLLTLLLTSSSREDALSASLVFSQSPISAMKLVRNQFMKCMGSIVRRLVSSEGLLHPVVK
jgi:hypothetical protein